MSFDPTTIVSTPNTWLERRVRYKGWGRAEFINPPGAIEGPATVRFHAGACRVSINVQRVDAADLEKFSLRTMSGPGQYIVHGEANPCFLGYRPDGRWGVHGGRAHRP